MAIETSSVASDSTRGSRTTTSGAFGTVTGVTVAPLQQCLRTHQVSAKVIDVDHYQKGLMTVDTDYIIEIQSLSSSVEQPFTYMISKTYHQFRSLCSKLKESSELATVGVKTAREFSKPAKFVVRFVDSVCKIIESEPVEYFAKVSYSYVKKLADERRRRINDALEFIVKNFPPADDEELMSEPGVRNLIKHIEKFFLTDHVVEEGKELPDYLKHPSKSSKSGSSGSGKKHSVQHSSSLPSAPSTSTTNNASSSSETTVGTTHVQPTTGTGKLRATSEGTVHTSNTTTPQKNSSNDRPPPLSSISMKTRRSVILRQADSEKLRKIGSSRSGLTIEERDATTKGRGRRGVVRGKLGRGRSAEEAESSISSGWLSSMVVMVPLLAVLLVFLKRAQYSSIHIDADYAALICFICFSLGSQLNSTTTVRTSNNAAENEGVASPLLDISKSGRGAGRAAAGVTFSHSVELKLAKQSEASLALLRKSMSTRKSVSSPQSNRLALAQDLEAELVDGSSRSRSSDSKEKTEVDEEEDGVLVEVENEHDEDENHNHGHGSQPRALIQSPLRQFPSNGDPERDLNCVSEAPHDTFPVRGANYLVDHKKINSSEMLFPCRGADLLLTDECPENVGRSSAILGGKLRDKPTFLINFRLPWGILIFYYEIPEKFLPYVQKRYDPSWDDKDVPSIDQFTPSEKCVARFLMGSDEHKKESLKILPKVVIGPWMVKSVVGTKPAIIGNKLPVNYVYGPPDPHHNKALYLEADLDIVASSAARKILGVVRSYTQSLTIDLGFLIEGKQPDELPEQMLVGTRIHGLDPLNASLLPPMPHDIRSEDENSSDDGSVDSSGTNR